MNAEDEKLVMQAMRDSSQLVAAMPPAVPSDTEAVDIVRRLKVWTIGGEEALANFGIRFMREALAAQEQRDPRSQSECYWDGWNDACDAVISTSYFKQLWIEMKRPRTDPLPSSERDTQS